MVKIYRASLKRYYDTLHKAYSRQFRQWNLSSVSKQKFVSHKEKLGTILISYSVREGKLRTDAYE